MNGTARAELHDTLIEAGYAALAQGAWEDARACFEQALEQAETPQALEGLGRAAWWMDDDAVTFQAREHAYQLYRRQDDRRGAARVATDLAYDHFSFRGQYAVANGWLQRASRLLDGLGQVPERGLLSLFEGLMLLTLEHDTAAAKKLGAQTTHLGRELALIDIEMVGLALEGLADVSAGEVAAGMRSLDESAMAATSGEMTDIDACSTVCCFLIRACEWVRDYERADEWCSYLRELARKWRLSLYFSYCRVHYACILIWRGEWTEAENMLLAATKNLFATRPAEASEGIVRLADLRRRQGRFEEAEDLLAQAEEQPFRMQGWHFALLIRGMLAFDRDDMKTAAELATRFLEKIPRQNCTQCLEALELLIPAHIACKELAKAHAAFANLQEITQRAATEPARAGMYVAAGHIALAEDEYETALRHFENAYDSYMRCGAPFDAARAQLAAAQTLLAMGRKESAAHYARNAHKTLAQLGAAHIAGQARTFLDAIPGSGASHTSSPADSTPADSAPDDLTEREIEVLQLIAMGKSNQAIADHLVLSVRTVERHISNIYQKIGVQGKAARAAATKYAFEQGIAMAE